METTVTGLENLKLRLEDIKATCKDYMDMDRGLLNKDTMLGSFNLLFTTVRNIEVGSMPELETMGERVKAGDYMVHEQGEMVFRMEVVEEVIYEIRRQDNPSEEEKKTYPLFAYGFQGLMKWVRTCNLMDIGSTRARHLVEEELEKRAEGEELER